MPHLVCLNSVAIRELLSKCYKHSDIIPVRCRYGALDNGTIMVSYRNMGTIMVSYRNMGTIMVSYRDMGTIMVSLRGQETKDPLSKVYFIVSSIFITLSYFLVSEALSRYRSEFRVENENLIQSDLIDE